MPFGVRRLVWLRVSVFALAPLLAPRPVVGASASEPLSDRVCVAESVHSLARADNDAGAAAPEEWIEKRTLMLRPRAASALATLLAEQQRPGSRDYHRWVTPEEYGRRFGIADEDLAELVGWLEREGLRVAEVPRGRGWLNFSGTVADVERAFQTRIHRYLYAGGEHLANATEISIPGRFAQWIEAGVTLGSFPSQPLHVRVPVKARPPGGIRPAFTSPSGRHALAPADFATIYNVAPLHAQGITGKGVSIAVLGVSNVDLQDVRTFRSFFELPPSEPRIVLNGPDPGKNPNLEFESDLDLEWSGAVAPDAEMVLVLTGGSGDVLFLSAEYAVDHDVAPIISVSFGFCEGASSRGWDGLWRQAAAQGISVFVASGDSGCAGCDDRSSATATHGRAVNGLASSPFSVAVGGTEFAADVDDPSAYWAPDNQPQTGASALSYIPEAAWNESGGAVDGVPLFAGGGGFSSVLAKQPFQDAPGVPSDSRRAMPDVSLTAAVHDPYLVFAESDPTLGGAAGTSASTPAFAGIAALLQQATGERQGNMNPRLYALARDQYGAHGFPVFHDVVAGDNSVPGAEGYPCGEGYDLVTGLGSVDAAALVAAWKPAAPAPCVSDPSSLCLNASRFRVSASWKNGSTGESGSARAVPLSGDTGYFWFFSDNNVELVVKALDGRPVNGKFWLFYGALTNVEYSIQVTDTTTGLTRSYFNPQGRQASVADVSAF